MQEVLASLEIYFLAGHGVPSFQQRAIRFPAAMTGVFQQRKCIAEPGGENLFTIGHGVCCGGEMLFSDVLTFCSAFLTGLSNQRMSLCIYSTCSEDCNCLFWPNRKSLQNQQFL